MLKFGVLMSGFSEKKCSLLVIYVVTSNPLSQIWGVTITPTWRAQHPHCDL